MMTPIIPSAEKFTEQQKAEGREGLSGGGRDLGHEREVQPASSSLNFLLLLTCLPNIESTCEDLQPNHDST